MWFTSVFILIVWIIIKNTIIQRFNSMLINSSSSNCTKHMYLDKRLLLTKSVNKRLFSTTQTIGSVKPDQIARAAEKMTMTIKMKITMMTAMVDLLLPVGDNDDINGEGEKRGIHVGRERKFNFRIFRKMPKKSNWGFLI